MDALKRPIPFCILKEDQKISSTSFKRIQKELNRDVFFLSRLTPIVHMKATAFFSRLHFVRRIRIEFDVNIRRDNGIQDRRNFDSYFIRDDGDLWVQKVEVGFNNKMEHDLYEGFLGDKSFRRSEFIICSRLLMIGLERVLRHQKFLRFLQNLLDLCLYTS